MNQNKFKDSVGAFVIRQRVYILLFLLGLLVRLVLMPYFAHVDLFSEYRRVYKTVELGSYFPDLKRLAVYYIELFFIKLSLPFISDAATTFHLENFAKSTADLESFFLFVNHDHVHRILFFFKLPYLLFDIGIYLLLFTMVKDHSRRMWALCVWWFNPITIFTFYLFGRFESIPLFFIMLTILLLQRNKILFSAAALGLAVNSREINIIYLPLFLLSIVRPPADSIRWGRHVVKTLIPSISILITLYLFPTMVHRLAGSESAIFGNIDTLGIHPVQKLFSMRFHWLVPFFFCYTLVGYWAFESDKPYFHKFFFAGSLCILSFLIFIEHSAHYVSWVTIFIAASLYFTRKIILPFACFCIAWISLWLFMTDAGVFTLFLATPLSPNFFGVKTIPQLYVEYFGANGPLDLTSLIWILRNIYAAVLVIIAYTFYRTINAVDNA